ncbi:MAG: serine/threonine-protein kinase [Deltaproteobacteria bacterium]|nr:serine/threonine-protein kinase [Deltaproteobacteria bacterium]
MSSELQWPHSRVGLMVGGRYRLERVLGEGGMGAVFQGRHATLGRAVAVKLMAPEDQDNAEAVLRFEQEAVAAASIARKGVVEVLDFGVDPVVGAYLVMEILRGESLEARIRREQRLSVTVTVSLLAQALEALSAVHARGIIHRDLKPANLFLSRDEEGVEIVKILDFGVSRVREGRRAAPTAVGVVVGTPRFMAPEQALGITDLDARADLYAMGAIAYACLSGRPPFAELAHLELLAAIADRLPTPLTSLVKDLPGVVVAMVERAMSQDRERRYESATEMREAMLAAMHASVSAPNQAAALAALTPVSTVDFPAGGGGVFGSHVPGVQSLHTVEINHDSAVPETRLAHELLHATQTNHASDGPFVAPIHAPYGGPGHQRAPVTTEQLAPPGVAAMPASPQLGLAQQSPRYPVRPAPASRPKRSLGCLLPVAIVLGLVLAGGAIVVVYFWSEITDEFAVNGSAVSRSWG